MENGLQELYDLPPRESFLLDLVEQCGELENQLLEIAENLPMEKRAILEAYIELRKELEYQSVKKALTFVRDNPG